jgi:hypothetical protein
VTSIPVLIAVAALTLIGKEATGIHFGTDRAITASATAEA